MATASGRILGQRLSENVLRFAGVPFAAPPVGNLRFAPPAKPDSWAGVLDTLEFGPAAPQGAVTRFGPIGRLFRLVRGPMDENCLTLNVWTPATDGEKRPVLVWLHGGAFVLGASSTFLYSASGLVQSGNVVIVSVNYRLGALGFLDLTHLIERDDAPSNLGLQDQIAALEWVQANIEQFGGDPGNVTVFGESAGAMSIGALLAAAPGLFTRAILQSGASANVSTVDEASYVTERFLRNLGVRANDFGRLREVDVGDILRAQRSILLGESGRMGRLPWQPSVDGTLLLDEPLSLIRSGSAKGVEVLIGTNLDEWKLFTAAAIALRGMSRGDLERRIDRVFERTKLAVRGIGARETATAYLELVERRGSRATPYEAWVAFRTDDFFRAPATALADAQSSHAAVYSYRFDLPIPAFRHSLGACHAAEVPLVFGTHKTPLLRPLYLGSKRVDDLSNTIQDGWLEFARSGRPRDAELGDWPRYRPKNGPEEKSEDRQTRIFGGSQPVLNRPEADSIRLWDKP